MSSVLSLALVTLIGAYPSIQQAGEYLPPHLFGEDARDDQGASRVASAYLRNLSEPSLYLPADQDGEVYRLLWLPPFDPAVMVRVERTAKGADVKVGVLPEGPSGGTPSIRTSTITSSEWQRFQETVKEARFWSDLENRATPEGTVVLDASHWILEGRRGGEEYKAVQRTPPDLDRDRSFLTLAGALLGLGGFGLDELGLKIE